MKLFMALNDLQFVVPLTNTLILAHIHTHTDYNTYVMKYFSCYGQLFASVWCMANVSFFWLMFLF